MQEIAELERNFGQAGAITFAPHPLGGIAAHLASHEGRATVALHGGQVLSWEPAGQSEVLWISPRARPSADTALRGGIPVCWPWFAVHPDDANKPMHGFVRTRTWDVVGSEARSGALKLMLATCTLPDDEALLPHSAEVSLEVAMGRSMSLALTTRNTGNAALPLTQALHTYFRVADIARVHVEGLEGRMYIDKVDGNSRKIQHAARLDIDREVDRIYLGDIGRIALIDAGLGRRIQVESDTRSAVVWNPWEDRSARMADIGPGGYRTMLCIETANAGDDAVTLPPGSAHTLRAEFSVSSL